MADDSSSQGSREAGVIYLMDHRLINTRLERLEPSLDGITRAMHSLSTNVDQHLINARLERLESSLDGITRAIDSLSTNVDRLLHAHAAVGSSVSHLDAHHPQVVHFRSLDKPKEDDFFLEMSCLYTYDDVVERVAQQLGLDDPSKIRLTPHNNYSQQPRPQPIKYRGVEHLSDMLVHYNRTANILYYEVLDIPLPELQGLKTLKVAFNHATKDEVVIHTIRLPKQSTVGDFLDHLKTTVELSHPDAELRLLEIFYHKIYKGINMITNQIVGKLGKENLNVFLPLEKIENIYDQYWTLRAEEIPEEEKNIGPQDRLIHVYHFTKVTAQNQMQIKNFGDPFFLVIHEGETLAGIKVRIQQKLQVPDEEFAKWKFAFVSLGRPAYLQDSDVVSVRFQRRDVYGAWKQYLGLEHADNAPKRPYTVNQSCHTFEKPRFIIRKPILMSSLAIKKWACKDRNHRRRVLYRQLVRSMSIRGGLCKILF